MILGEVTLHNYHLLIWLTFPVCRPDNQCFLQGRNTCDLGTTQICHGHGHKGNTDPSALLSSFPSLQKAVSYLNVHVTHNSDDYTLNQLHELNLSTDKGRGIVWLQDRIFRCFHFSSISYSQGKDKGSREDSQPLEEKESFIVNFLLLSGQQGMWASARPGSGFQSQDCQAFLYLFSSALPVVALELLAEASVCLGKSQELALHWEELWHWPGWSSSPAPPCFQTAVKAQDRSRLYLGSTTERWKLGIRLESRASIQGSYKVFSYPYWTSEHLTPLLRYALLLELKIFILFLISYVCMCLCVSAHRGQKC